MKSYLGFRSAAPGDLERLGEWLAAEALVQDRPIVLFHLACAQMYELRLVRPGLTVIERSLVGAAREAARRETARRVAPLLAAEQRGSLDRLLEVDAKIGTAPATWLRHSPVAATPGVMADEMDKLVFWHGYSGDPGTTTRGTAKMSPNPQWESPDESVQDGSGA